MSRPFGVYRTVHPWIRALGRLASVPLLRAITATRRFYTAGSRYSRERAASFREKLQRGESVYLLGISAASHNSGIALIEASQAKGVRTLYNNEEERFSGIKHCSRYPE